MIATPLLDAPATRVGFLLVDGFPLMSYASAVEPLRAAVTLSGRPLYAWSHLTVDDRPVAASNGVTIAPDLALAAAGGLDLLLVCAGGNPAGFTDETTFARLRDLAAHGLAIGGISGGAYLLARAGLLHGRRATLHWEHIPALLEEFPDLAIERSLWVFDRDRPTSAGGLAAFDMMVELIGRRHGLDLARRVSEWYLHTRTRSGDDAQRLSLRDRWGTANVRLLQVLAVMEERLEEPVDRDALARLAGVTVRQLERLFRAHLGTTLGDHYLGLRLERARTLLRQTSLSVAEIAVACGFAAPAHFSRVYRARFALSPSAERAPFATGPRRAKP
jgi:transcriptional regulator GlxA family with amidase domain